MKRWLEAHPLTAFTVLAYAWTWVGFGVSAPSLTALSEGRTQGAGLGEVIVLLAPFGPTFAAFVLTGLLEGRPGLRDLWRRVRLWRVAPGWYVFVLIWLVAFKLAGAFLWGATTGDVAEMPNLAAWPAALPRFVLAFFLGGPLGEEIGWRGYALPRLVARHGPLGASLRLGPMWALWHLPVFFIPGVDQYGQPIVLYAVMVTAYTFLFTWVHERTGGSLLLALLHHTAINTALWLTSMPSLVSHEWRLLALRMPGPWLVTCGLAWALVGFLLGTGAFARRAPVTSR